MRDTYDYYFQAEFPGHVTKNHHVTVPERPELLIEEIVDPNGAKRPGKQRWLPLLTKYFWPEEMQDESADLFKALAFMYEEGAIAFKDSNSPEDVMTKVASKLGKGILQRYHRQSGKVIEEWVLKGLWPHMVNFGELCYSTRADVEIEVTWRFFDAQYTSHKGDVWKEGTGLTTPSAQNSLTTIG